jgi:NitT/TauT family transport system substrate-binding protein
MLLFERKEFLNRIARVKTAVSHPAKAVDLLIKRLPVQERNRSVLIRQLELSFPSLETPATKDKPFGFMAEEDWTATQDLLVEYGGLSSKVPLDRLFTNDFVAA